jgi:predicted ATP-dependent endonuclease of OLD family
LAHIEAFNIVGLAGRTKPVGRTLDRHVNVFWGLNGSGKTSLLKILHSALDNDTSSLKSVPFESAEVFIRTSGTDRLIRRTYSAATGQERSTNGVDIEELESSDLESIWRASALNREHSWMTEILMGEEMIRTEARFQHSYLPISRVSQTRSPTGASTWRSSVERQAIDEAAFDEIFAEQVRRRWQAYSNNALISIREIQQQGLASILAVLFGGGAGISDPAAESIAADEAFVLVRDFLKDQRIHLRVGRPEFIKRYELETDLRQVVANIEEVTRDVQLELRPQAEFQRIIEDLFTGDKHLVLASRAAPNRNALQIEIGGKTIPLQSLSSGEKQLLQLLLEILAAESNTVMIDEPELSMHVDWQQRLVASMVRVNPNCQLLLATHSPEVMAEVPAESVFEL